MSGAVTIKVPSKRSRVIAVDRQNPGRVLAHGKSTTTVLAKARKKGDEEPVLMFVPDPSKRYIF